MIDVYGSSKGIAYCHFLQNLVAGWCLPYSLVILLAVPFILLLLVLIDKVLEQEQQRLFLTSS
jgi:hypothetical protein